MHEKVIIHYSQLIISIKYEKYCEWKMCLYSIYTLQQGCTYLSDSNK